MMIFYFLALEAREIDKKMQVVSKSLH